MPWYWMVGLLIAAVITTVFVIWWWTEWRHNPLAVFGMLVVASLIFIVTAVNAAMSLNLLRITINTLK